MSPDDAATLPADMLAPTGGLQKDLARTRAGMADAEKTGEQGLKQKDAALKGESAELGKEREQSKQFAVDHPFPHPDVKPWTAEPPKNDPLQRFGSWASAFGILAGAITKTGLASSLNASAAAMNAFRQNDMDKYNEAKSAWKENTEIALKNAEWEAKGYQAAFELMQSDQAAGMAQAQIVAQQADNQVALGMLKSNNLKGLWDITMGLQNHIDSAPGRMLQMEQLAEKMEDTRDRSKLLAQAYADDSKLPPEKQMTPEQKAQLRTRIMNPQYTINQAKTLAEGAGGGANSMANDPVTIDYWAKRVRAGEPMPSLGIGKDAAISRRLIAQKAAHDAYDEGDSAAADIVKRATLTAEKGSLTKLVAQQNAIHQFEQTAIANGRVALDLIDKVDSTGIPVIERWIRAGRKNVAGDPDVTAFNTQLGVFIPEVAKILSNPNMTGVLSDNARAEAENLVPGNITAEQLKRVIPLLEGDFGRRDQALKDEVKSVQDTIGQLADKNFGKDGGGNTASHPPLPTGVPDDAQWSPSQKKFWWKDGDEWKSQEAE